MALPPFLLDASVLLSVSYRLKVTSEKHGGGGHWKNGVARAGEDAWRVVDSPCLDVWNQTRYVICVSRSSEISA